MADLNEIKIRRIVRITERTAKAVVDEEIREHEDGFNHSEG